MQKQYNLPKTADAGDIFEISKISKECFGTQGWSLKSVADTINSKYSKIIIQKSGEKIIAYLSYTVLGTDTLSIDSIACLKDYRNRGVAASMIKYMAESFLLPPPNIKTIILEVRSKNLPAINLYKKFGFEQNGFRKKYYRDPEDDALLLFVSFDKIKEIIHLPLLKNI